MQSESIDQQLHELALAAKAASPGSRARQRALTGICQILYQPGLLRRRSNTREDIWQEARQAILVYVCEKIDNYDPKKGTSFLAWVNTQLKWRQQDLEIQWSKNEIQRLQSRLEKSQQIVHDRQSVSTLRNASRTSKGFIEPLLIVSNGLPLHMVQIPGGTFLMGSPADEPDRDEDEGPQHEVTVPTFFMGRYPITQAQYEAIMGTNPATEYDADRFVAPNKPVVGVSWHDAVAFCTALAQRTGRPYRLPSEAEWEYACRAGTTTPFYFGSTITTEVANYNGNDTYGDGPQGEFRNALTPVDHFGIANRFGLSDMHGNVHEWCQDPWHDNYEGAPTNADAWMDGGNAARRVHRGGSWSKNPWNCRSAFRYNNDAFNQGSSFGFRVACSTPRPRGVS